jgi:hypothetical protein
MEILNLAERETPICQSFMRQGDEILSNIERERSRLVANKQESAMSRIGEDEIRAGLKRLGYE